MTENEVGVNVPFEKAIYLMEIAYKGESMVKYISFKKNSMFLMAIKCNLVIIK